MQNLLTREAGAVWDAMAESYPALIRYDVPRIILNGRLSATAGRCFQSTQIVEMSSKFINHSEKYFRNMIDVILPHELAHAADWILFGESELKCGHGRNWQEIMVQYGLAPNKFHSMGSLYRK